MKLTRRDLSTLLKGFPNIELSYEKNIHKKVPSYNIYLTIPKGRKYFGWFKYELKMRNSYNKLNNFNVDLLNNVDEIRFEYIGVNINEIYFRFFPSLLRPNSSSYD